MKVGSLFSGVGGLDLGLERAGMTVAWQCEKDKQARSVLRKHWPDVSIYEDVHDVGCENPDGRYGETGLTTARHRDGGSDHSREGEPNGLAASSHVTAVDVICGGFPCQDYSVAGKRGGLVGDRGALWWEMHRIIAECRPTWVVGENVPGLLSSNGGRDFLTIIESLVQLGYGVTWATLDSQYFGVAQRRRRLFVVGHLGGVPRPEVLAISEGLFGHPAPSREARAGSPESAGGGVAGTLFASGAGVSRPAGTASEPDFVVLSSGPKRGVNWDGGEIAGTLGTTTHRQLMPDKGRMQAVVAPTVTSKWAKGSGGPAGSECGNLVTQSVSVVDCAIPRRLTPIECERLQGFPDNWTEFYADGSRVADGPRYRMMGNAVTVNVAEWIGQRIMSANEYS